MRAVRMLPALLVAALVLLVGCSSHDSGQTAPAQPAGPGLDAQRAGYSLSPISAPTAAGQAGTLSFRITGPDGAAVTRYDDEHTKRLHLIIARDDTSQYRHVHPAMAADGTWSIPWTWPVGGGYRVFTDFTPTGGPGDLVLSRTVSVSGDTAAAPIPPPSPVANADSYQVRLTGALSTAGSMLTFTISKDGAAVTDLDPYLGAYGHLVALRTSDLAYLHVHPLAGPPGPTVTFHAEAPSAGQYRLFLNFSRGGAVHTAVFTATAAAGGSPSPETGQPGMNMPGMN